MMFGSKKANKGGSRLFPALVVFALLSVSSAYAHSPLMMVEDNEDGTITVTAGFSTGHTGKGRPIRLKSKNGGKVLWEGTLDKNGELVCPKQAEPYTIFFDGAPGHTLERDGIVLKPGETVPEVISTSPAQAKTKTGKGKRKPEAAAESETILFPQWDLPLGEQFSDGFQRMVVGKKVSVKNSLGLVRTTTLMQCYQYLAQRDIDHMIATGEERLEAGRKVDFTAPSVGACVAATTGYLAMDFAIRELYGEELPVMDDFRIACKARMGGIWFPFELILGRKLSREGATGGFSAESLVFTAERISGGRRITFTYSDAIKERIEQFFQSRKNRAPEDEIERIRKDVVEELVARRSNNDTGYFVILEAAR
jgi:hypothetical protein